MARLSIVLAILLAVAVVAEAVPDKPKKAKKCHDKVNYPECFHANDIYCPSDCPRDCFVECTTCQPMCYNGDQPPPSYSSPPPPKQYSSPPPPPPFFYSSPPPPNVPTTSSPPPPVVPTTSSPPPPVVPTTSSPPPPLVPTTSTPPPPNVPTTSSPPPPDVPTTSTPPPSVPTSYTPPPPPSSESAGGQRVKCKNKNYPRCVAIEHRCPAGCPDQCEVDCVTCSPVCNCDRPGAVCQDPRFIGGDGITFYFHGKKDQDFCIVSDSNLHINAHFIGRRNDNMKRDFTWVQSLGILFDSHKLFIAAKKTSTWDDAVDRLSLGFNDEAIHLREGEGATWQHDTTTSPRVTITRSRDANSVVIDVEGNFKIKATVVPITEKDSVIHKYGITQEDCFAHLDLSFKFYTLSGEVNGVLGQTYGSNYTSRVKMGVLMPVLGGDKEFASSTIFSTDCAVSRFVGEADKSENSVDFANLNCASGFGSRGVVCKR